ncbi:hypothetical protein COLO4_01069, partial [Corchorus olitorius]
GAQCRGVVPDLDCAGAVDQVAVAGWRRRHALVRHRGAAAAGRGRAHGHGLQLLGARHTARASGRDGGGLVLHSRVLCLAGQCLAAGAAGLGLLAGRGAGDRGVAGVLGRNPARGLVAFVCSSVIPVFAAPAQHLARYFSAKAARGQKAHLLEAFLRGGRRCAEALAPYGMGALQFGGAQLFCGGAHQAIVQPLAAQLLHHARCAKARGLAMQHGLGHALGADEAALLQRVEHGAQVLAFLHMGGELAFQLQP